jgi:predicted  nucleic acid-binding Zn-ribbon protein
MSEDLTQNLPQASFEERVLNALSAVQAQLSAIRGDIEALDPRLTSLDTRLTALEDKVDRRPQETRPVWEGVQEQIRKLDTKFDIVIRELYEVRYDHVILGKRVDELEKSISR